MKSLHALGIVALGLACGSAFGQADTEPLNDTPSSGDVLFAGPVPITDSRLNIAGLTPGDRDFFNFFSLTGEVVVGVTTPLASFGDAPDTLMQFWDPAAGAPVGPVSDDAGADNSGFSVRGSAIRARMPQSGNWSFGVTGFPNFGFAGAHAEAGPYAVTMARFSVNAPPGSGNFADVAGNNVISGAAPLNLFGSGSVVSATAMLDPAAPDVDFYSVDLLAGDILTAITAPLGADFSSPDTLLGVFDAGGSLLLVNDDAGSDFAPGGAGPTRGSVVRFLAPASGRYYLGVTGFPDNAFTGGHGEVGMYGLAASIVPAPGALALGLCGMIAAGRRRRS